MRKSLLLGCLLGAISPAITQGLSTHSEWLSDFHDSDFDIAPRRRTSGPLQLSIPVLGSLPQMWFNPDKEQSHIDEVNARMKVLLNSAPPEDSTEAVRLNKMYASTLKTDKEKADMLAKEISLIDGHMQAELPSNIRDGSLDSYSLVQLADPVTSNSTTLTVNDSTIISDWTYCTCGTGQNGTLAYPERAWPSSMLQVTVAGRHMSIPKSYSCDCLNPWENFNDESGSSTCALINEVTICLVRVNAKKHVLTPVQVKEQATQLLKLIDDSSAAPINSFVEMWKPFQFQL